MTHPTEEAVRAIAEGLTKAQRETWRPCPGFECSYAVSNLGRVKSLRRFVLTKTGRGWWVRERIIFLGLTRKGYPSCRLWLNGSAYSREVHRLICRAFHGEPPSGGLEVAHKDGNRLNCASDNLRWATRKSNHADKRRHGTHLIGEAVPNSKLTAEQAIEIYRRARSGENTARIAADHAISDKAVRKIMAGEMWADFTAAVRAHLQQEGRG